MVKYCIRTRLIDKPDICLYYKGMEAECTVAYALNVVVAFTINNAQLFDKEEAEVLCSRLNEDKKVLAEHDFSEFEIIRANSD